MDKRLIDANALMVEVAHRNALDVIPDADFERIWIYAIVQNDMFKTVKKAHTIDAVEVVRCRECRHHDPAPAVEGTVYCSQWDICVSDGGYCHCGEMEADHGKET